MLKAHDFIIHWWYSRRMLYVAPGTSLLTRRAEGFSLVELSIVLVILGLLVGGVLTGQSLIRAAELRSVSTEFSKYQAAVHTFRDKYFAIPGDMNNATSFWGAAHATPATCLTTVGTGTQTCNGNGDGIITNPAAASQYGERFTFWQHLANAGLVEGSYTGRAGPSFLADFLISTNAPPARLPTAGWSAHTVGVQAGNADIYAMDYSNILLIGRKNTVDGGLNDPVLTPEDAWNIDTKMDDGKPARGKVIARFWNNLCAAADDGTHANNDLAASYKLTDTATQCALYFIKAF